MPKLGEEVSGRTQQLCAALLDTDADASADRARDQAAGELAAHLDAAQAASSSPAVERVVALGVALGGTGVAYVPGRTEELDVWYAAQAAALAVGRGPARAGSAVFGSVLAVSQAHGATVGQLVTAYTTGRECQLRIAPAVDACWDSEGSAGVLGAAAGAGAVLGLGPQTMALSLGIAASQTLGLTADQGTDLEAWHPAKAAANGALAALLALRGLTTSADVLDAHRGLLEVVCPGAAQPETTPARWMLACLDGAPGRRELGLDAGQEVRAVLEQRG